MQWVRLHSVATAVLLGGCYSGSGGGAGTDSDSVGTDSASGETNEDGSGDSSGGDDGPPTAECDGEAFDPGPNLVRRLTVREYGNTVEALLGVDVRADAVELLPAELRADGFTNTASGLITTLQHVESYDALAEMAVARLGDVAGFAGDYTSCQTFEDNCKRDFVENFGRRAYRRPLTTDEIDALTLVFDIAQDEGEGFDIGTGLVIEAMLQSPPFLYRMEDETTGNDARALGGYEMASRLSYLIWSGPPDDQLLDAADGDTLKSDMQVRNTVDRMLGDPRARDASVGFVRDWLNLARLDNLPRDPARFPNWSTDVSAAMDKETTDFFLSVAWDQERNLLDLYTAQETWLTDALATYYGIPSQGDGLYDVAAIPERGGLLTQGSLLTIGGDDSSMVSRGLFVFENILCEEKKSPPDDVNTTPPDIVPGEGQREHSEARTGNAACAGCHLQFEPFAWGLGRYLADGTYALQDHLGNDLREDGELRLPGEGAPIAYEDAAEMMELIESSEAASVCFGKKSTQFAIGRPIVEEDDCSIGKVQEAFANSDGTWRDLIVAIALSPGFRSIRVE